MEKRVPSQEASGSWGNLKGSQQQMGSTDKEVVGSRVPQGGASRSWGTHGASRAVSP